jgi:hypothetical protein
MDSVGIVPKIIYLYSFDQLTVLKKMGGINQPPKINE